jgi:hypothetical protein
MALARFGALLSVPSAFLLALALPTAFVVATIYFGTGSVWPENARKSAPSTVVEWGGRSFTTRRGFKMWLEANGGNYRRWAKRHPDAAALLSGRRRAPRAVAKPATSRGVPSGVPLERRVYLALIGLAAGVVAFLSVSLVRRLPRVSIPAVALGGYGSGPGRLVAAGAPTAHPLRPPRRRSLVAAVRPRVGTAAERSRSLVGHVAAVLAGWSRARRQRVLAASQEWDRFDVVFAALCVGLGLTVGILVPLVLAP